MSELSDAQLAEYLAERHPVDAHHEAGHAVAAVLRGGTVEHIALSDSADGLLDTDRDGVARTRHRSAPADWPFIAFAGPWAQWRFEVERGDASGTCLYEWLGDDQLNSCSDDDPLSDYAMMGYSDEFMPSDACLDAWASEIEPHWPAIVAVAAEVLAAKPVNTGVIAAIIDQHR